DSDKKSVIVKEADNKHNPPRETFSSYHVIMCRI
ncbi:MAG: hypothetical protein QOF90_2302, partial [Acetobacteraceae bacterium]|nr:hypothetical protein [Acetobacteraceae bacterium]